MFNRSLTILAPERHTTEYVTRQVHEHRAPTDDSVKLLREMEDKAREQIVKAVHVGDHAFDCVVHHMRHHEDMSTELAAILSVNGRKMTVRHRARPFESDPQKIVTDLRDKIAIEIANEILAPALRDLKL